MFRRPVIRCGCKYLFVRCILSPFFSPFFFCARNIGGHSGSANANFHPFIPVTHNPLKRGGRKGRRGGRLRVDWIETEASIIRDYPRMRKIFTKISGRNWEFQLDEIPCFSRVRFNINRGWSLLKGEKNRGGKKKESKCFGKGSSTDIFRRFCPYFFPFFIFYILSKRSQ